MNADGQPRVLGGTDYPIGSMVTFLDSPASVLADGATSIWALHHNVEQPRAIAGLADGLTFLAPVAPGGFTREIFISCRNGWTAYMNNSNDMTALGPALSGKLQAKGFAASHSDLETNGFGGTQFWCLDPAGSGGFGRQMTVWCDAGRWGWDESGTPFEFEDVARYKRRVKRERFDRPLLIEYLGALGFYPDDPGFFDDGLSLAHSISGHQGPLRF